MVKWLFFFFKNLIFKGTVHEMESLEESYEMDCWSQWRGGLSVTGGGKYTDCRPSPSPTRTHTNTHAAFLSEFPAYIVTGADAGFLARREWVPHG